MTGINRIGIGVLLAAILAAGLYIAFSPEAPLSAQPEEKQTVPPVSKPEPPVENPWQVVTAVPEEEDRRNETVEPPPEPDASQKPDEDETAPSLTKNVYGLQIRGWATEGLTLPVANARIWLQAGEKTFNETYTDVKGYYSFVLPSGIGTNGLEIWATAPQHVTQRKLFTDLANYSKMQERPQDFVPIDSEQREIEINFGMPHGAYAVGKIAFENGDPADGAVLHILQAKHALDPTDLVLMLQKGKYPPTLFSPFQATTNDEGFFATEKAPAAEAVYLTVFHPKAIPFVQEGMTLQPDGVTPINIVLKTGAWVHGIVTDEEGNPITSGRASLDSELSKSELKQLRANPSAMKLRESSRRQDLETNFSNFGTFDFPGLHPGASCRITVASRAGMAVAKFELVKGMNQLRIVQGKDKQAPKILLNNQKLR